MIAISRTASAEKRDGIIGLAADIAEPTGIAHALRDIERIGSPDILVNNAGAFAVAPVVDTSPDLFTSMLELNLVAPFRFIRALVPSMRARGLGHIVTIGSVADHIPFPGNGAYAASKFALRGLHEVLRGELVGTGVRATLVSPSAVGTDLWEGLDADTRAQFPARNEMLDPGAVARSVVYAVTQPAGVNVDEIRISRA